MVQRWKVQTKPKLHCIKATHNTVDIRIIYHSVTLKKLNGKAEERRMASNSVFLHISNKLKASETP